MNCKAIQCSLVILSMASPLLAQSNVDPTNRFAWCENIGWTNWRGEATTGQGAHAGTIIMSGFVWGESIGWIHVGDGTPAADCDGIPCYGNVDDTDFGVNVAPDGTLDGLGWGENVGWINFDTVAALGPHQQQARMELCDNTLAGYAWGENIGWINLDDATHFVGFGPDCASGDVACDGVIGLTDYSAFQDVLLGPDVAVDCPVFDSDADGDVDLRDFAEFQTQFTG